MEFSSYPFVFVVLLVLVAEGRAKIGLTNSEDEILGVNSMQQQCEDICLQKVNYFKKKTNCFTSVYVYSYLYVTYKLTYFYYTIRM